MAESEKRPMVGKTEIVNDLAEKLGESKKRSGEILTAVLDVITDYMKEGKGVRLIPFGNFSIVTRNAREGRRPGAKDPNEPKIMIPARDVPVFKAGKALKDAVKEAKEACACKGKKK